MNSKWEARSLDVEKSGNNRNDVTESITIIGFGFNYLLRLKSIENKKGKQEMIHWKWIDNLPGEIVKLAEKKVKKKPQRKMSKYRKKSKHYSWMVF